MSRLRSNSITVLFTCLVICFLAALAQAKYSGIGNGEPDNPYRIADANDMNEIGTHTEDLGAYFICVNDINLAEFHSNWCQIGDKQQSILIKRNVSMYFERSYITEVIHGQRMFNPLAIF